MTTATARRIDTARKQPPNGSRVAIHAIQTGTVRVRQNQVRGEGSGIRRLLNTFVDQEWSDWLPVYAWLIEHPEKLILVDTGETSSTAESGYFPDWHPYYRRGVELRVKPEQEIGPQLEKRGFSPEAIEQVVMTHLHTDHAGGLHHFPNSEIIIARSEYERASGLVGKLRGYLPNHQPAWLNPTLTELDSQPYGPFPASQPLTSDGAVRIVPTPGHTPHHLSVVVDVEHHLYFLAGDTSYNERLLIEGVVDGVAPDDQTAADSQAKIRELARSKPTVYLPSHDPDAAIRLLNLETLFRDQR